jgi:hypothetical protein
MNIDVNLIRDHVLSSRDADREQHRRPDPVVELRLRDQPQADGKAGDGTVSTRAAVQSPAGKEAV